MFNPCGKDILTNGAGFEMSLWQRYGYGDNWTMGEPLSYLGMVNHSCLVCTDMTRKYNEVSHSSFKVNIFRGSLHSFSWPDNQLLTRFLLSQMQTKIECLIDWYVATWLRFSIVLVRVSPVLAPEKRAWWLRWQITNLTNVLQAILTNDWMGGIAHRWVVTALTVGFIWDVCSF